MRRLNIPALSGPGARRLTVLCAYACFLCALCLIARLPALNPTPSPSTAAVELPTRRPTPTPGPSARARLDLNHADAWMLTAIPGVGETTAERIVAYREEHGGFCSVEELDNVPGIGEARAAQIALYVFVEEKDP